MKSFLMISASLLAAAECFYLEEYRTKSPPATEEIIRLVKFGEGIEDLNSAANRKYAVERQDTSLTAQVQLNCQRHMLVINLYEMNTKLTALNDAFVYGIVGYLKRRLILYCLRVIDEINSSIKHFKHDRIVMPKTLLNKIKFDSFHGVCVLSFLYHIGLDVDIFLKTVHFFKTLSLSKLEVHVYEIINNIDDLIYGMYNHTGYFLEEQYILQIHKNNSRKELKDIRLLLGSFSRKFCSSNITPVMVDGFLFEKDTKVEKEPIGQIMKHEKCFIFFPKLRNPILKDIERISRWDCSGILTDEPKEEHCHYTLSKLKETLFNNMHYLNVVMYSNIASDVMMNSLVKEGETLLQGVRIAFENSCPKHAAAGADCALTENKVRAMSATLFLFESCYDEFSNTIRTKYPANGALPNRVMDLKTNLRAVSTYLDKLENKVCGDDHLEYTRLKIEQQLSRAVDVLHAEKSGALSFWQHYFVRPVLRAREIFHYSKTEF